MYPIFVSEINKQESDSVKWTYRRTYIPVWHSLYGLGKRNYSFQTS